MIVYEIKNSEGKYLHFNNSYRPEFYDDILSATFFRNKKDAEKVKSNFTLDKTLKIVKIELKELEEEK